MADRMKIFLHGLAVGIWPCGLRYLCYAIVAAGLVGCITTTTTPGILVEARSKMYSPVIGEDHHYKTVAVFLNWHGGCALEECGIPRLDLHDRAAACIQMGLKRVSPDFRAFPGPVELDLDTSALVADPRERGKPDSRFDANLVQTLRKEGIRYAIVLDVSRVLGARVVGKDMDFFWAEPVGGATVERQSETPVHVRARAILIELDSRRWIARAESSFQDTEADMVSVPLVYFVVPVFVRAHSSSSTAANSACEDVGEQVGYLLLGKQRPR